MDNIYHQYWQQELMYQLASADRYRKRAYVCSPFRADTHEQCEKNLRTARAYMFYANKKMNMNAAAPHAYLPLLLCDEIPAERAIALRFGLEILEQSDIISAVLSGQDTILPDDVKQTICGATKLHAQDILNQLRELQVDLRSNPAVFIGGGSLLLRPFLEASPLVAKADFVESPNANALGYEMLGRVQLSHRPA